MRSRFSNSIWLIVSLLLLVLVSGTLLMRGTTSGALDTPLHDHDHDAEATGTCAEPHGADEHSHDEDAHAEEHSHEVNAHVGEAEEAHNHSEDDGHDHGEAEPFAKPSEAAVESMGLVVDTASPGRFMRTLEFPAEVRMNEDKAAHISPRLAGTVREVRKSVGDHVEKGEVMAVLESRELADAQAEYLAAKARVTLAQKEYQREKSLWQQEISAEKDYLAASRELDEAGIQLHTAEQKLAALGISGERLARIGGTGHDALTRYEMTAPFSGEVIEKHIVLGEALDPGSVAFEVSDLSTVWVDMRVYEKDVRSIREGQQARVTGPEGMPPAEGVIAYVAPIVDTETRTALARVVLPNEDGQWRPGLFINVHLAIEETEVAVAIPKSAVQRMDNESLVFVETEDGMKSVVVQVGREDSELVEIVSGLAAGQRYVAQGAFELKAQLVTSGMGAHAGHGH